ncbi:MAG: chorismate mutase [Firmicutes bacterium]|nr:chorismate mutase [Bacillota bacterium]
MNLDSLRMQIDQIDQELMELFKKRIDVSFRIGEYKKIHNLPILDSIREQEILLQRKREFNDEKLWPSYESLLKEMMRLSKEHQK